METRKKKLCIDLYRCSGFSYGCYSLPLLKYARMKLSIRPQTLKLTFQMRGHQSTSNFSISGKQLDGCVIDLADRNTSAK